MAYQNAGLEAQSRRAGSIITARRTPILTENQWAKWNVESRFVASQFSWKGLDSDTTVAILVTVRAEASSSPRSFVNKGAIMSNASRIMHFLVVYMLLLSVGLAFGDDWPQWRGQKRDGISKETGLRKEWPKDGPKLLWQIKTLSGGYSTPSVVGGRVYLMNNKGVEDEFVTALEVKDGSQVWSTRIGKVGNPGQNPKFPAARSTPTVDAAVLYALGSDGDLVCLETANGKVRWKKSLRSAFGGKPGIWAYSESPL